VQDCGISNAPDLLGRSFRFSLHTAALNRQCSRLAREIVPLLATHRSPRPTMRPTCSGDVFRFSLPFCAGSVARNRRIRSTRLRDSVCAAGSVARNRSIRSARLRDSGCAARSVARNRSIRSARLRDFKCSRLAREILPLLATYRSPRPTMLPTCSGDVFRFSLPFCAGSVARNRRIRSTRLRDSGCAAGSVAGSRKIRSARLRDCKCARLAREMCESSAGTVPGCGGDCPRMGRGDCPRRRKTGTVPRRESLDVKVRRGLSPDVKVRWGLSLERGGDCPRM
jgi:hypothetical protein